MTSAGVALVYALFVWWFSTGLVFLLVLRTPRAASLMIAVLLVPASLYGLARASADPGVLGAYAAFTSAIVLWGAQEIGFLTGFITGPRPAACPSSVRPRDRFVYAVAAILYHELALLFSGVAVAAVSWGETNQVGPATFLILWIMRLSAKLNLFLGVPVLNDEMMPSHIAFLRSYFVRGPANRLYLPALGLAVGAMALLVMRAWTAQSDTARVGGWLLSALLGLAVVEHVFMLIPLPVNALWRWSTGPKTPGKPAPPARDPAKRSDAEYALPPSRP